MATCFRKSLRFAFRDYWNNISVLMIILGFLLSLNINGLVFVHSLNLSIQFQEDIIMWKSCDFANQDFILEFPSFSLRYMFKVVYGKNSFFSPIWRLFKSSIFITQCKNLIMKDKRCVPYLYKEDFLRFKVIMFRSLHYSQIVFFKAFEHIISWVYILYICVIIISYFKKIIRIDAS